ncbi:MAG: HEAT repeat domain-containing protein [Planctomycetes bacterium]|nr:HEAT repeat domain-containing protein [Planctomycetota bacterium]
MKTVVGAVLAVGLGALCWSLARPLPPPGEPPTSPREPLRSSGITASREPERQPAFSARLAGLPVDRPLASQREVRAAVAAGRAATPCDAEALTAIALGAIDPTVAGVALRALGRLGRCADDPALLALAADPRPRVRQELVLAVRDSPLPAARAVVERARCDPDPGVRALACAAAHGNSATSPKPSATR